ncbi:MAG: murein biosynthesis integral membrane protein MurJ [Sphingomonadaceae bacterium]|uniref:murein biosynthesis integral membrane protein MurJ n=1 Tax=Thermaurantiacus sp. TaxID=2820283 RepID=UPI00298EF6AE|nr:murein biosynthesis integral membrane protein MurJ [Thermaurantiacus sp.]MCS6985926.1 murein biosynthesis integral membrane protein MurJ [Sphingomonadaceae bacterium]MDW8414858.1 murein biosynthesis integral membrane protein MurJ [Thermaurantiacus sp.]
MSLIRAATTVGGFTLASRLLGFLRDMAMARFLGAGLAADAFLVAFRLPNLFRSLFAEGAFAAAFVPMAARRLEGPGGRDGARRFAEHALACLLPLLLGFTALMMVAAGPVVLLMTGGFRDAGPEKLALAVDLTRLTFPYLLLISLVSLLGGLLNTVGRFGAAAAAPILLNLVLILAMLLVRGQDPVAVARALAAGVTVAGIAQFLFLLQAATAQDLAPRLVWPRLSADVRTLVRRIGPAAVGAGAAQVNLLVSTVIAARFLPEGSVSYLYYADRLNQLPLGIIGIGMGVALLPALARLIEAGRGDAAVHQQNRAIEFALFLSLPAAVAFVVAARPLVMALFQHGRFTPADTAGAAAALSAFALGLPAYVLVKVLAPAFHARGDTRTPMTFALVAIAANLVGNVALAVPLAHVGIALATAASAWLNVGLLWAGLRRRGHFAPDAPLRRSLPRMGLAAVLLAAALAALTPWAEALAASGPAGRLVGATVLVGAGALVYLGAGSMLGAWQPRALAAALRRSEAARPLP